ncbi:HPP family protein [Natrinema sp. 74]|uniref:HPP family protein n=1 Tax=Natrinema sp. 74 TaxID=3384159 RepID=UPI0038D3FF0B
MDRSRDSIGNRTSDIVIGLARRFDLSTLEAHHDHTVVLGAFAFVNGLISMSLMGAAALATREPFIFPSLGPTAFLFFHTPLENAASPRNTVYGHLIGILAGWFPLAAFGLLGAGPALPGGISGARVGAAALSLALTAGVMVWLHVPHPPAGATTLMVSLGLLTRPVALGVLLLAVVLLTLQALLINRAAGLDYPLWKPNSSRPDSTESD